MTGGVRPINWEFTGPGSSYIIRQIFACHCAYFLKILLLRHRGNLEGFISLVLLKWFQTLYLRAYLDIPWRNLLPINSNAVFSWLSCLHLVGSGGQHDPVLLFQGPITRPLLAGGLKNLGLYASTSLPNLVNNHNLTLSPYDVPN
jgi:hypothetical protein